MIRLNQLRRGLGYVSLGVLVLAHILTFTVWQAYISGRVGPLDYALPALMLVLAWLVGALLVRRKALLGLWMGLVAVLTAANGVLYQYYHSMHVPLTASDLVPMLQLTWAQLLSAQLHFLLRSTNLAIFSAIMLVVGFATILLTTLLRPHNLKRNGRGYDHFSNLKRQNWAAGLALLACIGTLLSLPTLQTARHLSAQWHHTLAAIPQPTTQPTAHKDQSGELYLVVLGSGHNRDFMGLYSGLFATTPHLSTLLTPDNSIIATNAYAGHGDTMAALSAALSNRSVVPLEQAVSLGALMAAADVHTVYLSNRNRFGLLGTDLSGVARGFDEAIFLAESRWSTPPSDAALIPALSQVLSTLDPQANNLVVVQLNGLQSPYPSTSALSSHWTQSQIGNIVPDEAPTLSAYLNSLRAQDEVLASLITTAQAHPAFMGLIYCSDYGQALDAGHNWAAYEPAMARIPLLFTFAPRYAARYGDKLTALRQQRTQFWVNDQLFDLVLDLMAITSPTAHPERSLAASAYEVPDSPLAADAAYQLPRQLPTLPQPQRTQLTLHRSDSLMKFAYAHNLGLTRAEIDLSYDPQVGLCLNHNGCKRGDALLQDFLQAHRSKLETLWLDIKDLTTANEPAISALLHEMDERYDLKAIALVESSYPEALPPLIAAGWQTSYYLPWAALLDPMTQAQTAERVLQSITDYGLTGVSYDSAAFDWVNAQIQAGRWPQLKQYLWDLSIDLSSSDIAGQMAQYEPATIVLAPLHTYFDY